MISAEILVVTPAVIRDPGSSVRTCQPGHGRHWELARGVCDDDSVD